MGEHCNAELFMLSATYAESHILPFYAQCRCAERRYAECRGALVPTSFDKLPLMLQILFTPLKNKVPQVRRSTVLSLPLKLVFRGTYVIDNINQ
jgi:hypothetical protein